MKPVHAILLVEDNPADIKITERALRESALPVQLIVARDGQEAMDYLQQNAASSADGAWRRPDLILLDLNLPRLSGHEVLRKIRSMPDFQTVPVILLTTSKRDEDVQEVYAAGANTYIEKPADFDRFIEVLRTIKRYWLDMALLPPGRDGQ